MAGVGEESALRSGESLIHGLAMQISLPRRGEKLCVMATSDRRRGLEMTAGIHCHKRLNPATPPCLCTTVC